MERILKVFCTASDRAELAKRYEVIENYEAFALARVKEADVARLSRKYLVEDVTPLYTVRVGDRSIKTSPSPAGRRAARAAGQEEKPLSPGPHHYLVQFRGPIREEWLKAVRKAGGEPRILYQAFTYVVRADRRSLPRISALPFVRWVGHLPHWARVATSLRGRRKLLDTTAPLSRTRLLPNSYTVEFFGADDLAQGLAAVKRLKLDIVSKNPKAKLLVVHADSGEAARRKQIEALSAIHGVRSVRERSLKRTCNNIAAGIMGTAATLGNSGLNLSGQGERVGVCDTGLDTGDPATIHPDFAKHIAWIKSYPITSDFDKYITNPGGDDGPADLDSGHGTHTSGSAVGSGVASAGLPQLAAPIRGLAYRSRLVFQAVEQEMKWKNPGSFPGQERYLLAGIPLDLGTLFGDAYKKGARIHSNSWGGGDPGAYDSQCEQLDGFVWEHKDFCIVVAAGNDGTDKDGDGKINPMSVTSPGTAKNCITVGACENRRPDFNKETYGAWWPSDFPVAPFKSDPMSDQPNEVVAFSSRGPTLDGRIKPEVIAPGTFILSTRSTQIAPNNTAWAAYVPSKLYFFMGGTSMATPLTAGAVALVRQFLRTSAGIKKPTAALLKAALIAGATRLRGYAPKTAVADNHQGFGRVNLDAVLAPAAPASVRFLEVKPGLRTGELHSVDVEVKSSQTPLRVVLAYTDYPGRALVNNLNLIVHSPSGKDYAGNSAVDSTNNVEVVHVAKPAAGLWQIRVVGSNVPQGPQDFALTYLAGL
ncbi:MAG TPA: S8 family serine peptidase [Terriglobia bacterium]|nr:S8 family serine peptidase [Terriglobia bacterium]